VSISHVFTADGTQEFEVVDRTDNGEKLDLTGDMYVQSSGFGSGTVTVQGLMNGSIWNDVMTGRTTSGRTRITDASAVRFRIEFDGSTAPSAVNVVIHSSLKLVKVT
jgi:hypothetical protein